MTSPIATYNTWDGDPGNAVIPRRPSTEDVGYDDLENDTPPPNPTTDPTAEGWNQRAKQIVSLAKVADVIRISVTFSGGTPSISNIAAPSPTLVIGDLTVVDNGPGDTSITWPANTFPPSMVDPHGFTLNGASGIPARAYAITNGVRCITTNLAGSATDINFTVCVG